MTTAITNNTAAASAGNTATRDVNANDAAASQDRFLKLLVAQLNNQDPMNPLDNAQMTSQIAQINTVTGIQQLNDTVKGLASQFASQQLMQATGMVGRQVLVEGDSLVLDTEADKAYGALDLAGPASSVKVQVLDANGKELGVVDLGSKYEGEGGLRFKVMATNGDTAVDNTPLSIDQISAVSLSNGALQLELAHGGTTTQSGLKAIL